MLLLVLVALAPPTVMAVVVAFEEREDAREHAEADVSGLSPPGRRRTGRRHRRDRPVAGRGGAGPGDAPRGRALQSCCWRRCPRATDWYSSVGVAGPDGRVYCRITGARAHQAAGADERVRQRLVSPRPAAARVRARRVRRRAHVREKALIGGHQSLRNREQRPDVMFVTLDLERLTRSAGLNDAPPDTVFVVLDHRGTVVARVPPARARGAPPARPAARGDRARAPRAALPRWRASTASAGSTGSRRWGARREAGCSSPPGAARPASSPTRITTCAASCCSPALGLLARAGPQLSGHEAAAVALDRGGRGLRPPLRRRATSRPGRPSRAGWAS